MHVDPKETTFLVVKQLILLLILVIMIPSVYASAESVKLTYKEKHFDINQGLMYYLDAHSEFSASEVYQMRNEFSRFTGGSVQIPRDGVMWFLLRLENITGKEYWILQNAMNVELMELFARKNNQWTLVQKSGNLVPFRDRTLYTRLPAFEVRIPSGEEKTLLIRLFDYQSSSVQLSIADAGNFSRTRDRKTFLLGLAFGFFAALIIYNLFVFVFTGDRTYLFYSLYMTAFFFNQSAQERLFSQFIQPNQPYGFFWFILFGSATAVLGIQFFRSFIGTKKKMPRLDLLMRVTGIGLIFLSISAFFYSGPLSADILNLLSLLTMGLIFTALIIRIIKKDILALVCFLGSLLYLSGTAAEIVTTFFPTRVTPFILHAQLFGALAQVLFLGFAVGANTHRLRKQNDRIQRRFREDLERRVFERTRELEKANKKLALHAITDALTGLYNRGELDRRMKELNNYLTRKDSSEDSYVISAAYLDLDNFKHYNDTRGHDFGDQILIRTAEILRHQIRGYDLLFRIGGDEFLIIMPETDIEEAGGILERIRSSVVSETTENGILSVSIGAASTKNSAIDTMEDLVKTADRALLRSKEEGKNRICFI